MVLANHGPTNVCMFTMIAGESDRLENWLGKAKLKPGEQASFSVRPGVYSTAVIDCDQEYGGALRNIRLDRAVYLDYGQPGAPPPMGYAPMHVARRVLPKGQAAPAGGGDEAPAAAPEETPAEASSPPPSSGESKKECLPSGRRAHWHDECCSGQLVNNPEHTDTMCK